MKLYTSVLVCLGCFLGAQASAQDLSPQTVRHAFTDGVKKGAYLARSAAEWQSYGLDVLAPSPLIDWNNRMAIAIVLEASPSLSGIMVYSVRSEAGAVKVEVAYSAYGGADFATSGRMIFRVMTCDRAPGDLVIEGSGTPRQSYESVSLAVSPNPAGLRTRLTVYPTGESFLTSGLVSLPGPTLSSAQLDQLTRLVERTRLGETAHPSATGTFSLAVDSLYPRYRGSAEFTASSAPDLVPLTRFLQRFLRSIPQDLHQGRLVWRNGALHLWEGYMLGRLVGNRVRILERFASAPDRPDDLVVTVRARLRGSNFEVSQIVLPRPIQITGTVLGYPSRSGGRSMIRSGNLNSITDLFGKPNLIKLLATTSTATVNGREFPQLVQRGSTHFYVTSVPANATATQRLRPGFGSVRSGQKVLLVRATADGSRVLLFSSTGIGWARTDRIQIGTAPRVTVPALGLSSAVSGTTR